MGAAVKITRTEYTSAELRKLSAGCSDGAQVPFDRVITVDGLANLENFLIRELVDAPGIFNADLGHDFARLGLADAVNVLKRDNHALVRRDVDACDAGHA